MSGGAAFFYKGKAEKRRKTGVPKKKRGSCWSDKEKGAEKKKRAYLKKGNIQLF